MRKKILNLFNIKSTKIKKFSYPLHEDSLSKEDLLEATKVLISRQLTMSKKTNEIHFRWKMILDKF